MGITMGEETEKKQSGRSIITVTCISSKNRITIPSEVRDIWGLKQGDNLIWLSYPDHIGIVKVKEEHFLREEKE